MRNMKFSLHCKRSNAKCSAYVYDVLYIISFDFIENPRIPWMWPNWKNGNDRSKGRMEMNGIVVGHRVRTREKSEQVNGKEIAQRLRWRTIKKKEEEKERKRKVVGVGVQKRAWKRWKDGGKKDIWFASH